jgi:hypothetical protein
MVNDVGVLSKNVPVEYMKNQRSLRSVLVTNGANHNRLLRYARVHLEPRECGSVAAASGNRDALCNCSESRLGHHAESLAEPHS